MAELTLALAAAGVVSFLSPCPERLRQPLLARPLLDWRVRLYPLPALEGAGAYDENEKEIQELLSERGEISG